MRPDRLTPVRARLDGAALALAFRRLDAAALAVAGVAALLWTGRTGALAQPVGAALPLVAGGWAALAAAKGVGAYRFAPREPLGLQLLRAACAGAGGSAVAVLAAVADPVPALPPALAFAVLAPLALLVVHALAWARVRALRRAGRLTPNVVVVGATDAAAGLIERALSTGDAAVLGIFDDRAARTSPRLHGVPVLGPVDALTDHKLLPYVDRIVITLGAAGPARVRELVERLRYLPNAVTLLDETPLDSSPPGRSLGFDLAALAGPRGKEKGAGAKRAQDLVLGGLLTLVAAPVMLAVAAAVRLDSPGPILFRQKRHGFSQEPITVWKFRSMRTEASDAHAARQVTADDDRVTRVGRFIRRTSLDELPQLFNVLSGEMSLVGPRPHAIGMKTAGEDSARLVTEYAWRHRMKPGLTGWAQINGSRGPVHTADDVRRRVALDLDYIERQSFLFDLYILAMTLPRLLGDGEAVR
jgi:exopolysaccharide biosynthesis polyprenyl glycosylphosphotransferase